MSNVFVLGPALGVFMVEPTLVRDSAQLSFVRHQGQRRAKEPSQTDTQGGGDFGLVDLASSIVRIEQAVAKAMSGLFFVLSSTAASHKPEVVLQGMGYEAVQVRVTFPSS